MNVKPIKNEPDYLAALKRIDLLWDAMPNTAKGDQLEILSILVEHYEQEHYQIAPPDPIDAIKFRMEQMGMKKSDLAAYVGGRNRSTEILSGKRDLSVTMLRNLHSKLKVPAESLLSVKARPKTKISVSIKNGARKKLVALRKSAKLEDLISPLI